MDTIKLNKDDVQALVTKTILDTLTPEKRAELIQGALTELFGKQGSGYRFKQLFEAAVSEVVRDIVKAELETPAMRAQLNSLVKEALELALTSEGDSHPKVIEHLAGALIRALSGQR